MRTLTQSVQEQREIAGERLWDEPEFLAKGLEGRVYRISNNLVAKVGYAIFYENKIMSFLYEQGISIPKSYGIHTIPQILSMQMNSEHSLVMEYIRGKTGIELSSNYSERNLAYDLVDIELKKARDLGFIPGDVQHLGNFILTPDKKIVLLDFTEWTHPDIPKPHFD